MKTRILLLIGLGLILFQCTEENVAKSPLWGVDFSEEATSTFAQGAIEQQNDGPKVVHIVNNGSLRQTEGELYTISFSFENGETLQLTVTKKTSDYNYHFPGSESGNQLVSATFNGNALSLTESSISIQPRQDDNKLNVVTNMHTLDAGDFNGTLTRVPLIGG
jgi:hypothetical protein